MTQDLIKVYSNIPENNILSFEWSIIDQCQNSCHYCSSIDFNKGTFINFQNYKLVIAKLKTLTIPFRIDLVGGEPSLHPNLGIILNELNKLENCKILEVCTNLKKSVSYFLNLNVPKLKLTISYHPTQQSNKRYLEKILKLQENNINIDININLLSEKLYWDQILEFIKLCEEHKLSYGFNLLHRTRNYEPNYDFEFFQKFNLYLNKQEPYIIHIFANKTIILNESEVIEQKISYNNMFCEAKQFRIDLDGRIFNDCSNIEYYGLNLKNLVSIIKCPVEICKNQIKFNYEKTI
jgi:molybdenum cofactor biosynthesis enzyme MoaA